MQKIKTVSMVACLFAGVCFSPAYSLDLSLNDAITKIEHESHDLKKAQANVNKAEASLDAANANRWFSIEGTASYMNMVNVENPSKSMKQKVSKVFPVKKELFLMKNASSSEQKTARSNS